MNVSQITISFKRWQIWLAEIGQTGETVVDWLLPQFFVPSGTWILHGERWRASFLRLLPCAGVSLSTMPRDSGCLFPDPEWCWSSVYADTGKANKASFSTKNKSRDEEADLCSKITACRLWPSLLVWCNYLNGLLKEVVSGCLLQVCERMNISVTLDFIPDAPDFNLSDLVLCTLKTCIRTNIIMG